MTGALVSDKMVNMEKSKAAQALARQGVKKRHDSLTPEEKKEYYRNLRLKRKDLKPQNTPPQP